MEPQTIILIASNIVVPIIVAIVTGVFQAKKYRKEIQLLNLEHINREKENQTEYQRKLEIAEISYKNEIDKLKIQFQHEKELEQQKAGTDIVSVLTDKLSDEIIKQPATQKMINQRSTQSFLTKKTGRKR